MHPILAQTASLALCLSEFLIILCDSQKRSLVFLNQIIDWDRFPEQPYLEQANPVTIQIQLEQQGQLLVAGRIINPDPTFSKSTLK